MRQQQQRTHTNRSPLVKVMHVQTPRYRWEHRNWKQGFYVVHNDGGDDDDDLTIMFELAIRKIYAQHHVILIHAVRCGLANVPFSNLLQIFKIKGICAGLYIHILLVVWWWHIYTMPHSHNRPHTRKYNMRKYLHIHHSGTGILFCW